jgi:choline-sulfatase
MAASTARPGKVKTPTKLLWFLAIGAACVAAVLGVRWLSPSGGAHDRPFNVLLISIDTLRADRLGCYGDGLARTPAIDGLAARGVLFTQATSSCPLTLPSHTSMLTGTYPFVHGARDNGFFVSSEQELLSERLQAAGYSTGAAVSAFVLNREFGLDRGFDLYDDVNGSDREPKAQRRGDRTTDRAIEWLEGAAQGPFFLFVHYFDPHFPYDPPEPFASQFADRYRGEIAFIDTQVGRLLEALRRLNVEQHTLVILTSDHGEGLGEHDEDTHGIYLYDTTLHVPLIVAAPGLLPAGQRVDAQVRLIDIAPTVLDLLAQPPLPGAQGESVVPLVSGESRDHRLAYAESLQGMYNFGYSPLFALRGRGWKLIHAPRPQLYHVASDPRELQDLAAQEEERTRGMRQALSGILEEAPPGSGSTGSRLSEEGLRRLQALGYLGTGAADPGLRRDADLFEASGLDPHDHTAEVRAVTQIMSHMSAGRFAEAETALRRALERSSSPESMHWALKNLGFILSRRGRHAEAIEHYQRAITARPGDGATLTNLATSLAEVGRIEEALEVFQTALEAPPVLARAHLNYGVALARQGRHDDAIEQLRLAVKAEPHNAEAALALARVLIATEREEEARRELWSAFDRRPGGIDFRIDAAELLLSLRQTESALAAVEPLRGAGSHHPRVVRIRVNALGALGRVEEAETVLRRALDHDPTMVPLRRSMTALLVGQERYGEAVAFLRAGLEAGVDQVHAVGTLAWLLATVPDDDLRDGEEALRLATRLSSETGGGDFGVQDILAAALAETGRFEEAAATIQSAIAAARGSGNPELAERLEERRASYRRGQPLRLSSLSSPSPGPDL